MTTMHGMSGRPEGAARIVLTTGGTGGHIFPALAVAREIRAMLPEAMLLFIGGENGPEGRMAAEAGLDFAGLPARGVLGRGLKSLAAPLWIGRGLARCLAIYRHFKPGAVIGFGGYAGFVPVLAATLIGVPRAVHEQNSVPGIANRVLARLADRVFLSFPDDAGAFPPAKTVLTGNPVRADIAALGGKPARAAGECGRRVLVLGGSQGARGLNDAVLAAAPRLVEAGAEIVHHAGHRDAERVRRAYADLGLARVHVEEFITDMAAAYDRADLVICRAGASTVFECASAGKPCLFVPFPHATHDHQRVNASYLERLGAALIVEEKNLPETDFAGIILGLLTDPDRLARMAATARVFARPSAVADIAAATLALALVRKTGRDGPNMRTTGKAPQEEV